jgi:N-acetylglucosaminyldiphosphoundecaprenol N-acetyl-beta-D-mannosaminyltransferase
MSAARPQLFGIPIAPVRMSEAVDLIDRAIQNRTRLLIGVVNAAKIVNMRRDQQLSDSVLSSDVIFADGFSVVLASRLLGTPLPERIAGIDLMDAILARGNDRRYRVYCLGATAEVLVRAERAMALVHPDIKFVGRHDGYFSAAEEEAVAEDIRRSSADVLFVAMTSPKKEQFLARWGPMIQVPVCHGVGGSFDVVAGKVKRAPERWQRYGFEWLYRVCQEPTRLWKRYLVTNSLFLGMLFLELLRTAPQRMTSALRPGRAA